MSQVLGQCVGLVSGSQWQNLRSVTEKAFTRVASTGYVQLVEERMKSYFKELQSSATLSQGLLDPAEDLKLLPFFVVAEFIYGKLSPELETRLRTIAPRREALFRHVIGGGLARFPVSKYLPTKANRALAKFRSDWHAVNKMAYDLAVSSGSKAPIISLYAAADEGKITHEQMYQTLDEMLYANLDVTLGGISWNVVFLAANREVQTSLRAEVAARRQEAANSGAQRPFDAYLLSSSTLLAACVLESARLRPLAAFSVPQSARPCASWTATSSPPAPPSSSTRTPSTSATPSGAPTRRRTARGASSSPARAWRRRCATTTGASGLGPASAWASMWPTW